MSAVGGLREEDELSLYLLKPEVQKSWVERVFQKRECVKFVPSPKDKTKCGCGRSEVRHFYLANPTAFPTPGEKWTIPTHTEPTPTDAYGTIEFQGGPHPNKAQYVRLAHDTPPVSILQLLQKHWGLELPKLLISVHGGIANFTLQPKLKRVFRKGLLKAAKTTGAWVVTGGTNTGVIRHVGDALGDSLAQIRNNIVTIGIAPWGVVHNRHDLIGRDTVTPYHSVAPPKSTSVVLNCNHSYLLLVDNGQVGKYGCEIQLRKKLEKYIAQQKITTRSGVKNYSTPVVCLVLEGGTNTIRTVLECITDSPPVPVVLCDGSGRAADLLAFTHKYAQDDGTMPESLRDQLILTIEKTFQYLRPQAEKLFIELMLCVKKKELISVFRMGAESQDIDLAILTALLKSQNASAPDQLNLALTWNRVDIARSHIFVYGQEWPEGALEQAMMDALVNDRVDFVQLLLENGISMHKWLTISRLEEIYNIGMKAVPTKSVSLGSTQKQDPSSTLRYLIRENKKHIPLGYRYTLYDIGQVIEKLMGGAYRATYCRRKFRSMYNAVMKKSASQVMPQSDGFFSRRATLEMSGHNISNIVTEFPIPVDMSSLPKVFKYPFHELTVWAVLLRRQNMAKFMWQHDEEAMAKALVACKLYKSMGHEAAQDDLEVDISDELKQYSKEFASLSMELLEACYKTDDDLTQQLLTYELRSWSDQTCLSLAVSACHREFIANTCCQILLTEMWMGALRMRKYTTLKVILGVLFFPAILFMEFKSKEELQLLPQTMEEHIQDLEGLDSDSEDSDSVTTTDKPNQNGPQDLIKARNSVINGQLITADLSMSFQRKSSPLRLGKKIYEFYTAPVTKFWLHTIAYMCFLMTFTFIVLVRMHEVPTLQECYVIAYIFTMALDKVREVLVSEPKKMSTKLYVYFSEVWNICDTTAIVLFIIGVFLRFLPGWRDYAKVFYCVDIIFWYTRILDLFSVSKYLGPYVMMIGKMVTDLVKFIVILLVVLMAFGVTRQAIMFPQEEWHARLLREVFLKPYFMLYGEVYADEINPECSDEEDSEYKCVPGRWVTPAVMSIYLIVANILLINLLIAVFNNTFHRVNAISTQVWKFQRYSLVIEFESKPILPPPLIVLCHIYLLVRYLYRRCRGKPKYFDNALKLFLDDEAVERLHDFEEECLEDAFRAKRHQLQNSNDHRVKTTSERVENMSLRFDDMNQKENSIKLSMQTVDFRLAKIEELVLETARCLQRVEKTVRGLQSTDTPKQQEEEPLQTDSSPSPELHRGAPFQGFSRSMNEDRLRPFTDYRKCHARVPFSRARTIATPVCTNNEKPAKQHLANNRKVSRLSFSVEAEGPKEDSPSTSLSPRLDLFQRRRGTLIRQRPQDGAFNGGSSDSDSTENASLLPDYIPAKPTLHVTFSEDSVLDGNDDDNDTLLLTPYKTSNTSGIRPETHSPTLTQYDANHRQRSPSIDIPYSPSTYHSAPSTSTRAAMPITPIITPTRSDYTSITDDIDTSCVQYGSPVGSPTTPQPFFRGLDVNVDLYTKKETLQKVALKTETAELRKAEESERDLMEQVIRKRIRQISLTESDSLGDIARHVMQDMDIEQDKDDKGKCGYSTGSNICNAPTEAGDSLERPNENLITPVQSEPFVNPSFNTTELLDSEEDSITPKLGNDHQPIFFVAPQQEHEDTFSSKVFDAAKT